MSPMSTRSSWCSPLSTARRLLSAAMLAVVASSAVGLTLVASVVTAASASAHTEMVRITPDMDAQLTIAPKEVVLEFSEAVNASFATVVVTTAARVSVTSGKPTMVGAKVTQALVPRMAAGAHRVAFRVVSNDGHPVTGESSFTLRLTPTTSPPTSARSTSPSATPSAAATDVAPAQRPDAGQDGRLSRSTIAIGGAVGLLLIGAGLLLWLRERA